MKYPRRKQHVRLAPVSRRALRAIYRLGGATQVAIAKCYNVTQPTVSRIVRNHA